MARVTIEDCLKKIDNAYDIVSLASQRAKDPKKKKDLGQAHKIYQNYIDTNKKSKD